MTEHEIEINAMDDARREIGEALHQLDKAAGMLCGVDQALSQRVALLASIHQIREIDQKLYKKIHPPQTT